MSIERLGEAGGRSIDFLELPGFLDLPAPWEFEPRAFILLVLADAREASDAILRETAAFFVGLGTVYACAWGPDCERVHDAFDHAREVVPLSGEDDVLMTTWHDDEPLDDALRFALVTAHPTEGLAAGGSALVVVSMGMPEIASAARHLLAEPDRLLA